MGAPQQREEVSLEHARDAAAALQLAQDEFCDAIVLAHEAGNSLHQIAQAVGFSHPFVRRIAMGRMPKRKGGGLRTWDYTGLRTAQERDASAGTDG